MSSKYTQQHDIMSKEKINNTCKIIKADNGKGGELFVLQMDMMTGIRDYKRQAILVSKALDAVTDMEAAIVSMTEDEVDKLYESLENVPDTPSDKKIII